MTHSIFNGEGYLLNDNRASGGKRIEAGVLGCNHCQACINKADWRAGKSGAYCPQCDSPICTSCIPRYRAEGCQPFQKRFFAAMEASYHKDQLSKALGL